MYTAIEIQNWNVSEERNGKWVPKRCSKQYRSLSQRMKEAWGVFTGKYDALDWEE